MNLSASLRDIRYDIPVAAAGDGWKQGLNWTGRATPTPEWKGTDVMTSIIASSVAAALLLIAGGPAFAADGDTDGRDFLVWQRNHAKPAAPKADIIKNAPAKQKVKVRSWDYKDKSATQSSPPSGRVVPRKLRPSRK